LKSPVLCAVPLAEVLLLSELPCSLTEHDASNIADAIIAAKILSFFISKTPLCLLLFSMTKVYPKNRQKSIWKCDNVVVVIVYKAA
jgi:hypothetical protein